MSEVLSDLLPHPVLAQARRRARTGGRAYTGDVTPREAWALVQAGDAVLVDVRSTPEHRFVGRVPGSAHVPWADGMELLPNEDFAEDLARHAGRDEVVLLLCRSGKRSELAAEAAIRAGFEQVYNVLEGFEGEADALRRRGLVGGWRFHGLPWLQD